MIFDKMVTLESPSVLPITSEIIEFLLPGQPNQNNIVRGGVQIFDVPGIIEGTNKNIGWIYSWWNYKFNYKYSID